MSPKKSKPLHLFFMFFLLTLLSQSTSQTLQTIKQETTFLLELKQQHNLTFLNWDSTTNPCTNWTNIQCSNTNTITHLSLSNFNITSPNSPPICNRLPHLTHLDLSFNHFTEPFPTYLYNCINLEYLDISHNHFTGPVPDELFLLKNLKVVDLSVNDLNGSILDCFWNLGNLDSLNMSTNKFSGEISSMFPWSLMMLDVSNNKFSGRIPSTIKSAVNLNKFVASNNEFYGEIPVELTGLCQLYALSLDRNRLSGQIPPEIFKSLITLNLSRNQLSGEIPHQIGQLPTTSLLNSIDLSYNQLSGEIPLDLASLKLSFLNLSYNQLTGKIPFEFTKSAFKYSFLNNPNLCTQQTCKPDESHNRSRRFSSSLLTLVLILSAVISIAAVVLITLYKIRACRRKRREQGHSRWKLISFQTLNFTKDHIVSSLNDDNLISSGDLGKVYRVCVNSSRGEFVVVKKIWTKGKLEQKKEKEFESEVQILGTIRHANIVKPVCCISCDKSKLLVYEYMVNRSLDRWLHGKRRGSSTTGFLRSNLVHGNVFLDWPTRLQIAVGAAQGLCYMHHDCSPPIIHRDVNSSNILLDSEFKAKLAGFGLAKMLGEGGEPRTISLVAGSFGYLAPECAYTTKVNEKIDIYSFGVVLLELVTGREANNGDEHTGLAEWAWRHFQDGKPIADALDEEVKEASYIDEMNMVFKTGIICTGTLPSTRPSMKEVLQILQYCSRPSRDGQEGMLDRGPHTLLATTNGSTFG